jgi:hypothetical protein
MGALRQDGLADETVGPNITWLDSDSDPCGGGVEYLHRDPASRRRRRKGKSQNWQWDSKIWPEVPTDWDPRKTALARASSIYNKQIRPLVREGVPKNKTVTLKQQ